MVVRREKTIKRKTNAKEEKLVIPSELPLMPVRDVVVSPSMILPLFVGRERSIRAIEESNKDNRMVFLVAQKQVTRRNPEPEDMYEVGTVAVIMRFLRLPDNRVKILVQGISKARIVEYLQVDPFYRVRIEPIPEPKVTEISIEMEALMRNVKEQSEKILSLRGLLSPDVIKVLGGVEDPIRLADLIVANLRLKVKEAQEIHEINDPIERLQKVNEYLNRELQLSTVQAKIQSEAKEEMTRTQREYYLREQLRAIKRELGELEDKDDEIEEFHKKILKARMPGYAEKEALKQLNRLEQMHPDAAEASLIRGYLEWLVELPWRRSTRDRLDLKMAQKVLDEDHYDLKEVKERILEYLGVRKLNKKMKGPILCFIGPPGVGKTSLGKSIARAMGRRFTRISLGGLKDEAEIRGHRRTYIGALPGRIIQGIKNAGSNNPVFMMDEIDKIGTDFRGDPSASLLEVLDPEQNVAFSDHYLNLPFDLSKVMFIATGNLVEPIPPALRDRMEIIRISGYTEEEKLKIALQYLLPRQIKEHGLRPAQVKISKSAILKIITEYTRESGLRNLEREIGKLCRKIARRVAEGERGSFHVTVNNLHKYLGQPKFLPDIQLKGDRVGVVTGVAYTEYGGEILKVEATVVKGKGALMLTGQLGEVMRESAQAAMTYTRSRADYLRLEEDFYQKHDIHIHVPAGAIPKDGPSAGVTITAALVSALTKMPARSDVAMTGEITLSGEVLPIGGLKEKALAAVRARIPMLVIPRENKRDLDQMPRYVKRKLEFKTVEHMDEILPLVFRKEDLQALTERAVNE
ncbi:MAG: endopeptidase La [Deltaproteobacteria bacterium]|nr:MAG: endopeptidase La [Deltaproteobacteria bacterium]